MTNKSKLILGDCIEEMKKLKDDSIDMALCDPPYGTTACKWDTVLPFELMWVQLKRIVKSNGAICLFGSEPFSSALRMSNIKMFKYDWIWHKSQPSGISTAKYMPMKIHEIISVFCKSKTAFYPIKEEREGFTKASIDRLKNIESHKHKNCGSKHISMKQDHYTKTEKLRNPTTVRRIASVSNRKGKLHPTQKPVDLLEYLIRTYTAEGETVLDFTMGSGSTGIACRNLDRNFIGIEKDETYFEIAKQRIKEAA